MRLMDVLASADSKMLRVSNGTKSFEVRGAGAYAATIRDCPLRYVLDDRVAALCEGLLASDAGMLDPVNALLRVQAPSYWAEWSKGQLADQRADRSAPMRVGFLVEAAEDGRSGTLRSFWRDGAGEAQLAQVHTRFDLDRPLAPHPTSRTARHEVPAIGALLARVRFHLEPMWTPYYLSLPHDLRDTFFERCVASAWYDLPMALALSAVVGAGSYVASRPSELGRLNSARAKSGKPALLDHVEATLRVGGQASARAHATGGREPPRLHQVRGHMVHRNNATFWRTTHLRGDPETTLLRQTIKVIA